MVSAQAGRSEFPFDNEPRLTLTMSLPADPVTPSVVRERLLAWLADLTWPAEEAEDVVLAVSEAVSNAAEHAYASGVAGSVDLVARAVVEPGGRRRVVVGVADRGRWRPEPEFQAYRGHGLTVMHATMHRVEVERNSAGTTVVLTSVAVPPPR